MDAVRQDSYLAPRILFAMTQIWYYFIYLNSSLRRSLKIMHTLSITSVYEEPVLNPGASKPHFTESDSRPLSASKY